MRKATDATTATDLELQGKAASGDRAAFDALHEQHAPLAWRLAFAVTGDPDLASQSVVDATGTLFTSLRAGRFHGQPHGVAFAAAARNAALDLRRGGATTSAAVADGADAILTGAFHALPERWRSVLWLRDAEALEAAQVAPMVELTPEAVDQLAVRARRGLRERYLRAQVATASARPCIRATSRLGALEDGTLNERDAATLEQHLRLCEACAERRQQLAGILVALPALAPTPPADLGDRSVAVWTAALASSTHTGLSRRTEKVLAGASAFAAALGVLGAALFGSGGGDEPTASPLAPLVADIDTPKPVDLSDLMLPLTTDAVTSARRSLALRSADAASRLATPGATADSGSTTAPGAGSSDDGPIPAVETPSNPLPTAPIAVDPDDSSISIGDGTVDLTPEDGKVIDIPGDTDDPVTNPINEVLAPVVEAAEPVIEATEPVIEATEPVTTTLTETVTTVTDTLTSGGGLGL